MLIDSGSEICVMSEEVTCKLNIGWTHAYWKMITANGNWSNLTKVVESMPVNIHGFIIPVAILFMKYSSQQSNFGRPWEAYSYKCDRNQTTSSCEIYIPAINWSEALTFLATFLGDNRNRLTSSSEIIYT